ncbi:MAG: hypothetical protein PHW33_02520 [Candidatus Portnoybacteria bacterium]|jgi:hypothetical protein|nr:hypothetical protein [Candidatus Portnoybacteria bacterium]
MKKFILGLAVGIAIFLVLSSFGFGDFMQELRNNNADEGGPPVVSPENLIEGATEFGSLKIIITAGETAFISGIEVDVGEQPGGKMAVGVTDENGTAFFEKIPVGDYVIFFNDYTFPKNFEKPSVLIPIKITEGKTTEQKIELKGI